MHQPLSMAEKPSSDKSPSPVSTPHLAFTTISNEKLHIPILLSFTELNYKKWSRLFLLLVRFFSLGDFLTGKSVPSNNDDTDWYQLDALIQGWILSTINDEVSDLVLSSTDSASELWRSIHSLFHDNKPARAMQLEHQFRTTKKVSLSISAYCQTLKNLADWLDDVDAPVSEQQLVLQVLRGLPDDMRGQTSFLQFQTPPPTFLQTRSALLLLEHQQSDLDSADPSPGTALFSAGHTGAHPHSPAGGGRGSFSSSGGRGHSGSGGSRGRGGAAISRWSTFFIKRRFPLVTMGKNRSKRNKIAAKARTNLEGKEKLSSEDLRHQITLSQSRRETQDKSCERSFHSKAPKSSHPKDSQAATEKFDANSPIVRKLIGWLNNEGEARSQGTGRETGQGEDEEVESQGRISVHKRMRKNASQRLGPRTEESGENSGGHNNEDAGDILKLRKEMEELKRQVDKDGSFGPTVEIISPFTTRVMKAQLPRGMKAPEIRYKGVTDPNDHLAAYQTHMLMHAVEDKIQCRLFVGTLEGPAVKWFLTLSNGTIDCFKDLSQLFLNAYGGRFQPKKHFTHLFSLKQKEGETNSELVQRWNETINEVEPMDDKTSIALFMNVLRSGELFRKLDYDTPTSYKAMMARVNKFCATEESDRLKGKSEGALHKGPDKEKKGEKTKAATLSIPTLKSLAAPVAEIKSKEEGGQKRKRGDQKRRQWPYDPEKYCNFHRRPGHATEECHFLKKMEGEMKDKEPNANREPNQGETGVTSKERKEWARKLYVGSIDIGQAAKKGRREPIVFSDEDLPLIFSPHRTPLVISMAIHKFFVKRILVDTGSSVNVLYWEAAQQLGIRKEDLTKLNMPLSGFTGDIIEPEGSIKLDIIIGEHPKVRHMRMDFVVVDIKCAHNAILGRPGLEDLGGALTLEHLCLKFRTPEGVGRVLGDQPAAKKAYLSACKKIDKENLNIQTIGHVLEHKERKEEDRERPKPAVEMEEVVLFPEGDQEKVVRIGLGLEEDTREEIIRVLRENSVLFAWESKDMPGVDPSVICHKLNIKMDSLPVKQKKRYLSTDRKEFVRKEVKTLLEAGHIREKGQVIADFMVECTARGKPEEDGTGQERKKELWEIHSDGGTRVEAYTPSLNEQLMEVDSHFTQERRDDAAMKAEEYQRQSKRYHDKKAVVQTFEVRDWVLRKREKSQPTKGGKLAQNWEEPYRVEKVVRTGTYQLATPEGKALDNYWNVEHLKKFYQ
ncbi:unnamed protein product [Cuscuta campestris]|uniref:Retrotransposon gag domain-containing protein n=1 Tax=Cuscuta campestris TaxID=132261 RepID=A0A484M5G1_9ASTE|nr:unnamed protein product [Cuscuta campestris]